MASERVSIADLEDVANLLGAYVATSPEDEWAPAARRVEARLRREDDRRLRRTAAAADNGSGDLDGR